MKSFTYDFLVVGAGIFGICTALELRQRGHRVGLLNPVPVPHPLAASTDISKIIRMEYGSDEEYLDMAAHSMAQWRRWNEVLGETIFHECGFALLTRRPLEDARQQFERASFKLLQQKNYRPERLDATAVSRRFPAFRAGHFTDGFFHARAGFAKSGRAVRLLADLARQRGVELHEGQTALPLLSKNGRIDEVSTAEGRTFRADEVVVCAGNFSHLLVPGLAEAVRITGHPVFHLRPENLDDFTLDKFPVFAADISNTGWYGFPLHPEEGVVKIANHGPGRPLHPTAARRVLPGQEVALRRFLAEALPDLATAPVVYTRLCCYTDTLDGHFWIDRHPEITNLTVGTGGSGHGFKMGPAVGEMIAAVATHNRHRWSGRYGWRRLFSETKMEEEARNWQAD